jgi:hypothetical protein
MKTTIIGMLLSPLLLIAQQSGGAWTHIGPSPPAVDAFVVDPRGTGTIFLGAIVGGVRKSVDGGITWSTVNTGLTNLVVRALAMDASGHTHTFEDTRDFIDEVFWARIYAGFHYYHSQEDGRQLGATIAREILRTHFRLQQSGLESSVVSGAK